ncbi:MAG: hypoxanthine phosphoribosyltransferase [Leptospiraceae bacterium]|nr:hypoxanthine phosphoribosyltransferase [Leptospiraceae bacterium]
MRVLLPADRIQARVAQLGQQIGADYAGLPLTAIGMLKGCFVFMADLVRQIEAPLHVDFIEVSSYGDDTISSGVVKIAKDFKHSIAGQHVLLVEDIIDTGLTLNTLIEILQARKPASVRIAALLVKSQKQQLRYPIDYRGFDIEDDFVVGYGMDFRGRYRNLDHVAVLEESQPELFPPVPGQQLEG